LNFPAVCSDASKDDFFDETTQMLAEKFFLLLETIISNRHPDSAPRVVSASPHVPVQLPTPGVGIKVGRA
jgi:hypothetical protein